MTSNADIRLSRLWSVIALLATCTLAGSAYGHHSFAGNYDPGDEVTVTGEVTTFRFTNPHGMIEPIVTTEEGVEERWAAVTNHPGLLQRRLGWTRDTFEPGDRLTITGARARNGSNTVRLLAIVREDGSRLRYSIAD